QRPRAEQNRAQPAVFFVATWRMSNAQLRRRKGASVGPRRLVKNHLHWRGNANTCFQLCPERLFAFGRKIPRSGAIAREFGKRSQLRLNVRARNGIPKSIL